MDLVWLGPQLTPEKPATEEKGYNVYLCTPYLEGVPINIRYGPDDFVTPQQLTPQPSTGQGMESPPFEPMKNVTGVKELGGDFAAMPALGTPFLPSAGGQPEGSMTPLQKKIVEMVISAQQRKDRPHSKAHQSLFGSFGFPHPPLLLLLEVNKEASAVNFDVMS